MIKLNQYREPSLNDFYKFNPEDVFKAGIQNHHISNTAYPISHNVTWNEYQIPREEYYDYITESLNSLADLCLYVHIPFCEKKCFYCEYTIVGEKEKEFSRLYVDYLIKEIDFYGRIADWKNKKILGFDIGGGTPSYLENDSIEKIVGVVQKNFPNSNHIEKSIETTPKIAASEYSKMKFYKDIGIDRISMGIQVADPLLLKRYNRTENSEAQFEKAVENIRQAGFKKFNIDLMYGFADQSLASWKYTIEKSISLKPDYITLYRMRYKQTKISEQAKNVRLIDVMRQSNLARKILESSGFYAPYGKNTFSKIESDLGTSEYLTNRVMNGTPYIGFGLGAQSFLNKSISYNLGASSKNLFSYKSSIDKGIFPIQDLYDLPLCQILAKMISVSFYFGGINLTSFQKRFGFPITKYFKNEISFLTSKKLIIKTNNWLQLTKKGEKLINGVIALFYAPSIKKLLLNDTR